MLTYHALLFGVLIGPEWMVADSENGNQRGRAAGSLGPLARHTTGAEKVRPADGRHQSLICGRLPARRLNCQLADSARMIVDVNGSRGSARFAYQFDPEMKAYNRQHAWSYQLTERVNLRIALMASGELTYPPRVREYLLGEMLNNHSYVRDGSPAIAFSFGWKTAQSWFVYVMQSAAFQQELALLQTAAAQLP